MSSIAEIRTRIENTSALIAQYENAIASSPQTAPPSLFANIRSLESLLRRLDTEFNALAENHGLEVYRYRLLNDSDVPALVGIAEAWAKFQGFFGSVYSAIAKQSKPKKKKGIDFSNIAPTLGYAFTFARSIGVVVTLPREATDLIGESDLNTTSELVFDLIESKQLEATARRLGPQPILALNELIEVHAKYQFGMGLQWTSPGGQVIRREVEIEYSKLAKLQSVIYETETKSLAHVPGELFAVNTKEKTFSFHADDGKSISGSFDDEAISWDHTVSLPARYRASLQTITKIVVMGDTPKVTVKLIALTDLSTE